VFAALSGIAVGYFLRRIGMLDLITPGPLWSRVIDYLVPGCLFAAGVFGPALKPGRTFVRRALLLVAASTLSFYVAVMVAVEAPQWFGNSGIRVTWYSVLMASTAGTGIVLGATQWLTPVKFRSRLWVAGAVAAIVGGLAVFIGNEYFGRHLSVVCASFAAWHVLLSVAILFGGGRERRFESIRPLIRSARQLLPGGTLWRLGSPLRLN
jgi:hypothetical protein